MRLMIMNSTVSMWINVPRVLLPQGSFTLGLLAPLTGQKVREMFPCICFCAGRQQTFECEPNVGCAFPNLFSKLVFTCALAQLFLYSCWIVRGSSQQPLDCWLWATAAIRALSPRESCLYSRGCRPPPAGKWSRLCPQAGGAVVWNAGHPDPRTLLS